MHNEIEARAKQAIEERVFPGCVIGVVRSNGEREVFPFGNLTYERDSPAVRGDTVYDVASITKSIPTASLALTLAAEGKFALGDKLVTYIPEFRSKWREEITLEHLLRYGIHGLQLSTLKDKTSGEILESAYSRELADTPEHTISLHEFTRTPARDCYRADFKGTLDVLARKYFSVPSA